MAFLVLMSFIWLFISDRWKRIRVVNRFVSRFCAFGLYVLNVHVNVIGADNRIKDRGALYVGNHLTYLDVLVISSQVPVCFVTSREIKETPVLGQVCTMAGCLFVERRNKSNIHNEISEITDSLEYGMSVAIFPEATSTNGESVLRFRRPLFMAAMQAGRSVIPFCINYRLIGGGPVTVDSRDQVFWYGDMAFAPHLWALSGCGGVTVDVHFLKSISTAGQWDAGELAETAHRAVANTFLPVIG